MVDRLGVALCNAKCHMSCCSVTVPEKPPPRDQGWEAVFAGAQMVWVMFVLLWGHGGKDPSWKRRRGTGKEADPLC